MPVLGGSQCPDCPLRFAHRTELDWHLREEHPDFRHEYPTRPRHPATRRREQSDLPPEASGYLIDSP